MKKHLSLGVVLCAASCALQAQLFHLGVDLTNPTAAVITATTQPGLNNSAATSLFDGATLINFLTGTPALNTGGSLTGTLRPFSSSIPYANWINDDLSSPAYVDLNLYQVTGSPNTQIFGTFFQPFISQGTLNLTPLAGLLPGLGATGDIYAGYSGNVGPLVGTWQITAVPELPVAAHLAIYGAGFAGLFIYRRTRKA